MVASSSWNKQINLHPSRNLVHPQHWFTITLLMNEFFELESLSPESITIFSYKICALYFYMCMSYSTYNTLWEPLYVAPSSHKGKGCYPEEFLLYTFVQRKWQQWRGKISSTAMIHKGETFCLFRCTFKALVSLPVAVIWVLGWDTQNTCIPKLLTSLWQALEGEE